MSHLSPEAQGAWFFPAVVSVILLIALAVVI